MSPRIRLFLVALAGCALLVPLAGSEAAPRCAKKKERAGCRLPTLAKFESSQQPLSGYGVLSVQSQYSEARGYVTVSCSGGRPDMSRGGDRQMPINTELYLPARMKVGRTYTSRDDADKVNGPTHVVYHYVITATITSAKRVRLKLSYDLFQEAAHPEDRVNPPYHCRGTATHTLKRVQ